MHELAYRMVAHACYFAVIMCAILHPAGAFCTYTNTKNTQACKLCMQQSTWELLVHFQSECLDKDRFHNVQKTLKSTPKNSGSYPTESWASFLVTICWCLFCASQKIKRLQMPLGTGHHISINAAMQISLWTFLSKSCIYLIKILLFFPLKRINPFLQTKQDISSEK